MAKELNGNDYLGKITNVNRWNCQEELVIRPNNSLRPMSGEEDPLWQGEACVCKLLPPGYKVWMVRSRQKMQSDRIAVCENLLLQTFERQLTGK